MTMTGENPGDFAYHLSTPFFHTWGNGGPENEFFVQIRYSILTKQEIIPAMLSFGKKKKVKM